MKDDSEHRAEVAAPVTSRRAFIRAASAASGAGILSAGLVPIRAQESAKKAPLLVLPPTTKDVTPFKVHVPQAELDNLKKRLAAARWPDRGPAADGPRADRWRKRRRSLNTGARATIGVVLKIL